MFKRRILVIISLVIYFFSIPLVKSQEVCIKFIGFGIGQIYNSCGECKIVTLAASNAAGVNLMRVKIFAKSTKKVTPEYPYCRSVSCSWSSRTLEIIDEDPCD